MAERFDVSVDLFAPELLGLAVDGLWASRLSPPFSAAFPIAMPAPMKKLLAMGKRNFRKGKGFGKRDDAPAPKDTRGGWVEVARENAAWETYYRAMGIVPDSEWATFKAHCQKDLPLTFRITGLRAHAAEIARKFEDVHVAALKDETFEGMPLAPKKLGFYPDGMAWQLDVPKLVIRKNAQFAATQRFLVLETTAGNISRQEAVLMIPPLLMDVHPHHAVLDMCAAPGLKTAQLVEALHRAAGVPSGFVVANDSDYRRSHMLVHQVKRLNLPNLLVVNHDAQLFPRIQLREGEPHVRFDRILCDVPCSGDGTMRKNINVWKDFSVNDGLGLHPLQVNILARGLQLLKEGGRLVYSTCSLLPIENEAVVAEALRRFDNVAVVDVADQLPGLVRRPGVSLWKVMTKDLVEKQPGDESVHATAFPPTAEEAHAFHLDRCVRVYPHLQNTGGFFITVFEKKAPQSAKRAAEASAEPEPKRARPDSEPVKQLKQKTPRTANEEPFVFLDAANEQLHKCWDFYDIGPEFPRDTELVRNATGEACRTIYYVSPSIAAILKIQNQKLKLIHAGIKIFSAQRNDLGLCPWRAQSECLPYLKPHLGPRRQVSTNLDMLRVLFTDAFPRFDKLRESGLDPAFCAQLDAMAEGCVFLNVKREGLEDLLLPLWKGKANVNLMVNKHDTQEMLMRFYDIETSAKDDGKEKIYQQKIEAQREASASASAEATAEAEPKKEE